MVMSLSSLPCIVCEEPVEMTGPHFRVRRIGAWKLESRHRKFALRPTHWDCYATWPDRRAIAQQVVKAFTESLEYTEGRILWSTKAVALAISTEGPEPDCAILVFAATGTILEIPFSQWDPDRLLDGLGPLDHEDLAPLLGEIRRHFPAGPSLVAGLQWEELKAKDEEIRRSVEHDIAIYRGHWPEVKPGAPEHETASELT
jgi:hypothetical protein